MKTLSVSWSKNYFSIHWQHLDLSSCLGIWIWIAFIGHSFTLENELKMETWNTFSWNEVGIEICVSSLMEHKSLSSPCSYPSPHQRTDSHCSSCWRTMNLQIPASSLIVEIPLILRIAQVSPPHLNLKVICGHFHAWNFWAHLLTLLPWTSLEDLWV